jgi:hypothetical protein
VVLPAGRSSASFALRVLDNAVREAPARVFLTARSLGYGSSFVEAIVADNDGPSLVLALGRASVAEGAGSFTATLTRVNVPVTSTTAALSVSLQSSNRALVAVPASVIIPSGRASVTFLVRVLNNTLVEATRRVALSASATGLMLGMATLDVLDDEVRPQLARAASPVRLSTVSVQASGQIQLRFTGALHAASAQDTSHYTVTINGEAVEVENAIYSTTGVVVLHLPDGMADAGDEVELRWNLSDGQGRAVEGSTGAVTSR